MTELLLKDSIIIDGENGRYNIDLCFGDITKLSKKCGVDVILVSAFPGSYAPIPGTMIGALRQQLGLNVADLSRSKAEDLRKDFNCWISKPLPDHLPYRRLICFERCLGGGDHTKTLYDMVGSLFRAFSTLFSSNDDVSVISPILGSGNQRYSKKKMMMTMVTSCAAWMRAGMPLKSMKLVVYVSNPSEIKTDENTALLKSFAKLKESLQVAQPIPKTITRKCDALLIFAEEDKAAVNKFLDDMKEEIPKVNACLLEMKTNSGEESTNSVEKWSRMMEEKMLDSKRVVIFLSPNFLVNKECIDNYNLALCLSRKLNNSLLAPIYMNTMPYIPTYLGMTQWIDCRARENKASEGDPIKAGAAHLCQTLSSIPETFSVQASRATQFDVFISYCHRNSSRVQEFVTALSHASPNLRIFIDKEGLKTGFAWQATLYSALSNSSLVVAFVSESYLKSKMCQEEFAIASSQVTSREFDSQLVTVQLESLEGVQVDPIFLSYPTISSADGDEKAKESFVKFVQENLSLADCREDACHMDQTLRKARKKFVKQYWKFNQETKRMDFLGPSLERAEGIARRVVICCHPEENDRAIILRKTLLMLSVATADDNKASDKKDSKSGNSNLAVDIVSEDYTVGHRLIESADFVLLMLSALFCTQPSTQALLNVALALGRSGKCYLQGVIVSSLPRRPSVLHLLPNPINLEDPFWSQFYVSKENGYPLQISETKSPTYWRFTISYAMGFQVAVRIASEWILHCLCDAAEECERSRMVSVSALSNIIKNGYFPRISVDEETEKNVKQLSQTSLS